MVEKLGFEKRLVYKLVDVIGTQPGNSESLEAVKKELNNYLK
jgi:septum formation inhibitor-activating ATPase MinD